MDIKLKKLVNQRKLVRVHSGGEIKEVLINADLIESERGKVQVCFRGQRNSGIVEFSDDEALNLYNTLKTKFGLVRDIKVIRGKRK